MGPRTRLRLVLTALRGGTGPLPARLAAIAVTAGDGREAARTGPGHDAGRTWYAERA